MFIQLKRHILETLRSHSFPSHDQHTRSQVDSHNSSSWPNNLRNSQPGLPSTTSQVKNRVSRFDTGTPHQYVGERLKIVDELSLPLFPAGRRRIPLQPLALLNLVRLQS